VNISAGHYRPSISCKLGRCWDGKYLRIVRTWPDIAAGG